MIIRKWSGRASRTRSAEYPKHFRSAVLPELRRFRGFLGATLSERQHGEEVEFMVLTRWDSVDAIRAFAGPNPDGAIVEPGAVAALTDYDLKVQHYQVLEDVSAGQPWP